MVINNSPKIVYATHCHVVDRCIKQLTSSARSLVGIKEQVEGDQGMSVDVSEADLMANQLEFDRSIMVLHELLKCYRLKPRYPPETQLANGHIEKFQISGLPVGIRLCCYSQEGYQGPVSKIQYSRDRFLILFLRLSTFSSDVTILRRSFTIKFAQ